MTAKRTPVALVTGATDGVGGSVARALGALGYEVLVHGRDAVRGAAAVAQIEREGGAARLYLADLSSTQEVRDLGARIGGVHERLDVLVHNAGVWLSRDDIRRVTSDGVELTFAVNYLSNFLLTHLLRPLLTPRGGTVVHVSSGVQAAIDFNDPMMKRGYSGWRAYGQSKLAQVMHTVDLASSLAGAGIRVNALHPGGLLDTRMVREAGLRPAAPVTVGRDAVLRLIQDPGTASGAFHSGGRVARAHAQAYDPQARERLRALSAELTGVSLG